MVLNTKVSCKSPKRCGTMFSTCPMPIGSRWIDPAARSSPRSCACGDLWLPEATFASRWQCSSVPGIHREVGPLGNHTIFGGRNDETWAPFLHSGLGQNWDMEPPHPSLLHYLQKQNKRWCPACDFCYSLCPYPPSLSIRISSFPFPSRLVQAPPLLS